MPLHTDSRATRRTSSAVLAIALVIFIMTAGLQLSKRLYATDIVPFLCGGEVVREHADPAALQPLYSCEQRRFAELHLPSAGLVPTPVPLPPYALAPFAALAALPNAIAIGVWYVLCLAMVGVTVSLLTQLTRLHPLLIFASIFVPNIYVSFTLGQIVPIIVAGLVTTAWAVSRERTLIATLAALSTMMEPNLGLPICLALFTIETRSRVPLAIGAACIGVISLMMEPLAAHIEYFRSVLPSQALSEVHNDEQLSLTHILSLMHLPDHLAAAIGTIAYLLCIVIGLYIAQQLGQRAESRSLAIVAVPAIALIGSSYIHVHQCTVMIVFGLLVYARNKASFYAPLGILLTALPLITPETKLDVLVYGALACIMAHYFFRGRIALQAIITAATLAVVSAVFVIRKHLRPLNLAEQHRLSHDLAAAIAVAHSPSPPWTVFMLEGPYTKLGWVAFAFDLPFYIGVACIVFACVQILQTRAYQESTATLS